MRGYGDLWHLRHCVRGIRALPAWVMQVDMTAWVSGFRERPSRCASVVS